MPLPTGTKQAGPPALKIPNPGDEARFAVVDFKPDAYQVHDPVSETPQFTRAGTPKMGHIATVLLLSGGHTGRQSEGFTPAEPNEVHTIFIESYAKWDPDRDDITAPFKSWGGCMDDLGEVFDVGYIGVWKHLGEVAGGGAFPRKDRKFRIRPPKAEEAGVVARCQELHDELNRGPGLPTSTPDQPPADPVYGDEEPF